MAAGALFITGLFLTTMACVSLFSVAPSSVPPKAPTSTARPTETSVPLYQQVVLQTSSLEEHGQPYGYAVTAQRPVLVGSQDPRVHNFNTEMKAIVDNAVAGFKQNLADLPAMPDSTASTFDLHYNRLSPPGNILSLKFDIQTYYTGAAHPGDTSQTVTYDLQRGQDLSLADLFVPDVDYLTAISKYCIAQLSARDIGFQGFELGATATAHNYRNWNLTADGLMITFDEYQVAPYAAGPQTVVIPYGQLAPVMQPGGPLASYPHGKD
jgi:hypothetical protein